MHTSGYMKQTVSLVVLIYSYHVVYKIRQHSLDLLPNRLPICYACAFYF